MSRSRHSSSESAPGEDVGRLRLDLWLVRTRFFKHRDEAATFVEKGQVRLTRFGRVQRVTRADFLVAVEDQLVFIRQGALVTLTVLSCPERRGPASEASLHYKLNDQDN